MQAAPSRAPPHPGPLSLWERARVRGLSSPGPLSLWERARVRGAATGSPVVRNRGVNPSLVRRRRLRRASPPAETALWYHLRDRRLAGFKFRRQQAWGPFIVDFFCWEQRLAIELDGGQHFEAVAEDVRRAPDGVLAAVRDSGSALLERPGVQGETRGARGDCARAWDRRALTLALSQRERGRARRALTLTLSQRERGPEAYFFLPGFLGLGAGFSSSSAGAAAVVSPVSPSFS